MNTNSSPRLPSLRMPFKMPLKLLAAAALLLFLQFAAFSPTRAATTIVKVGQSSSGTAAQRFNAASITITAGDTVRWEWFNGAHDVQGYNVPGLSSGPRAGIDTAGETYSFTFPVLLPHHRQYAPMQVLRPERARGFDCPHLTRLCCLPLGPLLLLA